MPTTKGLNVYILLKNGEVVGVWSNLKTLCLDMNNQEKYFQSYWTLVRKTKELDSSGVLNFSTKDNNQFSLKKMKVK